MGARELYDEIAPVYHLVYADWEASLQRQARELDAIFTQFLGPGPHAILDVSCGIGTQALGLAALGHKVTASDAARAAVARAAREAELRGLTLELSVGDMSRCHERHPGPFDVVLSADNSVPQLLTDEDLLEAFRAFFACTRPGGICVLSVRDYENEDRSSPSLRPCGVRETESGRCLVLQCWDWEGDHYDLTMYFLHERDGAVHEVTMGRSRYYAVTIDALLALLHRAGFELVLRLDGSFFQPVLLARRAIDRHRTAPSP